MIISYTNIGEQNMAIGKIGREVTQHKLVINLTSDKITCFYLVLKSTFRESIFSWPNNEHDTSFNYKYHDDI